MKLNIIIDFIYILLHLQLIPKTHLVLLLEVI